MRRRVRSGLSAAGDPPMYGDPLIRGTGRQVDVRQPDGFVPYRSDCLGAGHAKFKGCTSTVSPQKPGSP